MISSPAEYAAEKQGLRVMMSAATFYGLVREPMWLETLLNATSLFH